MVHRDLKPANIFICTENGENDRVKIVDFGIAKLIPQEGAADSTKITLTGYRQPPVHEPGTVLRRKTRSAKRRLLTGTRDA